MLDIGKTTLFALLKNGTLKSVKIGAARRVYVASIKELAETGTENFAK